MRKLFLIISLFFTLSCIGQVPGIGAFQIPGIQQGESEMSPGYGLLYNWWAANDIRNIANDGWRIPVESDFTTLLPTDAGRMKETGLDYWLEPNTGATNEFKFYARGAGRRVFNTGIFDMLKSHCYFWTSTDPAGTPTTQLFRITYDSNQYSNYNVNSIARKAGYTVRLVRETTPLSDGQTGTYTGNDGKVYQTICIGTQEWLAENLAETKYRNGNIIPEVTNDTDWKNLTTDALCAFDNDWNYTGRTKPDYY